MKLKENDYLLVIGPAHFEKVKVEEVLKNKKYKLANNMVVDKNLNVVSIINSKFTVEVFDQEKYDYLVANERLPKVINKLLDKLKSGKLSNDKVVKLYNKMKKIEERYL